MEEEKNGPNKTNKDLIGETGSPLSIPAPNYKYEIFIEKMAEAAIVLSKEGKILYYNPSLLRLLESSESIIGTSFLDFIPEDDRSYFIDFLHQKTKNATEMSIVTKKLNSLRTLISSSEIIWDHSEEWYLVILDLSPIKHAQTLIEATESIARILSMDIPLKMASQFMLEALNRYFDWEVMILWIWNSKKNKLQCAEISHIEGINIDHFAAKTREEASDKIMLSAHISTYLRPIWFEDVSKEPSFPRRNEAIESGLRGAFAFPFFNASLFGGVLELYSRKPYKKDVSSITLDTLTSIGLMFGLYTQRIISDETKRQLSQILDHSITNIYKADLNGMITEWNFCAEKSYGWKLPEITGAHIDKIFPPNEIRRFYEILSDLASGKSIERFQSERVRKSGEIFWVENFYEATHNFFGEVSGVCVIEQDITEQKNLEKKLIESGERLKSFLDVTQDWVWEFDRDGNIRFSNQMLYKISGYKVEELLGKSFLYYIPIEERAKYEALFNSYIEQKQGWLNLLIPCVHKNGSIRWHKSTSIAILDANDNLVGFRGANRDVTEQKNLEKIKDEFVSVMNHELRTPLTSIHGALTLLKEKEMSPQDTRELMATAQRNSLRLTKLVDDLMDVEKIQLGKLQYDFKKLNLKDVILESVHSAEIIASSFGIKLVLKSPLPDAEIKGDYLRLLQVMTNILSNAIKFSANQGTIYVSAEILNDFVRTSVEDFGPGIPQEFQPKVFDRFAQADSSPKRNVQGTGLGLSISKSIIEGHGGTIGFKTTEGEGTTFFFEIPLYKDKP